MLEQSLEAVTLLYLSEKWGSKVGEELISSRPTVAYIWGDIGVKAANLPLLSSDSGHLQPFGFGTLNIK